MCGYCIEAAGFDAVLECQQESPDLEVDLFLYEFYLQESVDLFKALKKGIALAESNGYDPTTVIPSNTFLCRLIDILLTKGPDSPEYQSILGIPLVWKILLEACPSDHTQNPFQLGARFGLVRLLALFDQEVFVSAERFGDLGVSGQTFEEVPEVLHRYIDWWLEGNGLAKNDLHQRMEDTGILDPIQDISESEREGFDTVFRAIWYSLNRIAPIGAGKELLWKIVSTEPGGVPQFDGKDLWIQRRATLLLYQREGIGVFLRGLDQVRPSLLRYLDLKIVLSSEEVNSISQRVKSYPSGAIRDDHFDFDSWLEGRNS